MLDGGGLAVIGPDDRHHVETAGMFEEAVLLEKCERGQRQSSLFFQGHRLRGDTCAAGLNLDEDQRRPVSSDEIDLALRRSVAAEDDPETLLAQVAGGEALAAIAE